MLPVLLLLRAFLAVFIGCMLINLSTVCSEHTFSHLEYTLHLYLLYLGFSLVNVDIISYSLSEFSEALQSQVLQLLSYS